MSEVANEQSNVPAINEQDVCVCFSLRKAARVITQIYDDVMRPLGYRATQVTLLGVIRNYEPITVKKLADFMDTDRTTLTRNLAVLQKQGVLDIREGEDRREREVRLTESGGELLAKAYPIWKETQDKIAEAVGKDRLNQLLGDLGLALEKIRGRS